jgi:outer membrane protein assembly factor BamB
MSSTGIQPSFPEQPSPSDPGIQTSLPEQPPAFPEPPAVRPRVWPAIVLVGAFWAYRYVVGQYDDLATGTRFFSLLGGIALLTALFTVWWFTSSRIGWGERFVGLGVVVAGGWIAGVLTRETLGVFTLVFFAPPRVFTTWTAWMLLARRVPVRLRSAGLAVVLLGTWSYFCLIRMDGLSGDQSRVDIRWRWSPREEEAFLAERAERLTAGSGPAPADARWEARVLQPFDWPGFRGPGRNSEVHGLRIATDWKTDPPRCLWRQRVGPGWSSFAVVGERLFTQEQRGPREAVVCLDAATGREVWSHEDNARFWDSQSGAGPRATPTFAGGRIVALGATGILNCLDAATGERKWSRDIAADSGASRPNWGFVSSPLVVGDRVIVFAGGEGPRNLLAYRMDSGDEVWYATVGKVSYTSPQLARLGGEPHILQLTDNGLFAVHPASGAILWEYKAPRPEMWRAIQPHPVGTSGVLICSEADFGTARLDVAHTGDVWAASERWVTRDFRPSFMDIVVHDGYVFGFDSRRRGELSCADARTGEVRWRAGKSGLGQVLLLADQALLVVVSEGGEAVLLAANPERYQELGRFQAIQGKTWTHPAIAGGRLYVRNAEEMACYELKPANRDR